MEEPVVNTIPCPDCNKEHDVLKVFCSHCGYPVKGTHDQKSAFELNKFKLGDKLYDTKRKANGGSVLLYVLAGSLYFLAVVAFLAAIFGQPDAYADVYVKRVVLGALVFITFGTLYLGLGLWARKKPFAALLTASIIFFSVSVISIARDFQFAVFVFQVIILAVLIWATVAGYKSEQLKRKLDIE
ncbi:MAG: hypothetical protein M0D57_19790 [Sphingobacteriales bacterium JAD_PAG50586_3]|nr:MAG: hypothetical protein M0D57_19790 [Sphingobacteriales bacterium JAD_PAG50586_3]